jgi:hypothetical protein
MCDTVISEQIGLEAIKVYINIIRRTRARFLIENMICKGEYLCHNKQLRWEAEWLSLQVPLRFYLPI